MRSVQAWPSGASDGLPQERPPSNRGQVRSVQLRKVGFSVSVSAFARRNRVGKLPRMLTLEGTYRDGKVELAEKPAQITQAKVLVTFLEPGMIDLHSRGIDESQAADLRARLKTFAEDWDRPEAAIYDENPAR